MKLLRGVLLGVVVFLGVGVGALWLLRPEPLASRAEVLRAEALPPAFEALKPLHAPKTPPRPGEWLAEHEEEGQSLADWRSSDPVRAGDGLTTLYLQPIGDFSDAQREVVRLTADYMERFFGLPVTMLEPLPARVIPDAARRKNPLTHQPQILSTYVLRLLTEKRPADAVAYLGLTAEDLYPEPSWNFVYGQASLVDRVGVWSLYRHGDPSESERAFEQSLWHTLGTALHETAHMLSMPHCIAYECMMNGSNHEEEAVTRPLEPCPVCLAKLCEATGCDPVKRLERIEAFWAQRPLRSPPLTDYLAGARAKLGASGAPRAQPTP
jgi:archaemetzincin